MKELVVVRMRPDPEPDDTIGGLDSQRAMTVPHPSRPEATELLEVKRRIARVRLQPSECLVGELPNGGGQPPIAFPELGRGVVGQRRVVLRAA